MRFLKSRKNVLPKTSKEDSVPTFYGQESIAALFEKIRRRIAADDFVE
jgi:hypothetical protein